MSLEATLAASLLVLAMRPSALVSDIDGTLSRIVPRPQDAGVSASTRASLQRLAGQLDVIAVITGREEAVARLMVGVPGITYIGSYALDPRGTNALSRDGVASALEALRPLLSPLHCVELEEKEVTFSLHYRNCDDPAGMRLRLLSMAEPLAGRYGAKVLEGKQVIEVAPQELPDKGRALARLVQEKQVQGVLFMGDDQADVEAFRELRRRRMVRGLPGLAVAVVDSETPASVRESADATLEGVDEVEEFLEALSTQLADESI
jgi:trehalose 6-phosphate phosphatase